MEIMTVVLLTMLRHKTWWLLVALACFVVVVQLCLWIFLMQVQLGLMSAEIRDLSSNVHQSNDFVRDYMHAYASSPIEDYVRFFYTYPKSEVESLNNLSQEDPLLIKHIKKFLLIRPPKRLKPRVLNYDVSKGQGKRISELFKRKTGGIFVEYGAANDHYESNTLFLEARYNWTGLLIVPNPFNFGLRYAARRNAWLLPVCISLKKSPMMAKFNLERDVNVHCMPLYSILKAFNATSIDFFSLDAQGDELDVLRTLPFDVFDVKTFAIKLSNINGSKEHLQQFMTSKGYYKLPSTQEERNHSKLALEDCIFVKKKNRRNFNV